MYKSIFETKPNKENKRMFCNRICGLLNDIYVYGNNHKIIRGLDLLNYMFKESEFNEGFRDIDDLLYEYNCNYHNIFYLSKESDGAGILSYATVHSTNQIMLTRIPINTKLSDTI